MAIAFLRVDWESLVIHSEISAFSGGLWPDTMCCRTELWWGGPVGPLTSAMGDRRPNAMLWLQRRIVKRPRQELDLVYDLRTVACLSGTLRGHSFQRPAEESNPVLQIRSLPC